MSMIRIFINNLPWSLSDQLHAYLIDERDLFSVRIMITKTRADASLIGGSWQLYRNELANYRRSHKDDFWDEFGKEKYEYIGSLRKFDKENKFYTFTARYKRWGSLLVEIALPDNLKELGLE